MFTIPLGCFKPRPFIRAALAAIATFALPALHLRAQPVTRPTPQPVTIDWQAVGRDARGLSQRLATEPAQKGITPDQRARITTQLERFSVQEGMAPVAHLNDLFKALFPGVDSVPVPVLVPFEAARFLRRHAGSGAARLEPADHRAFLYAHAANVRLVPGKTGYDALVTFKRATLRRLGILPRHRPLLHIGATSLAYAGDDPGELVADLQDKIPGLRRVQNDEDVTYAFRRYGVPYFALMTCSGDPRRRHVVSYAEADRLLRASLINLSVIGGAPVPPVVRSQAESMVAQPTIISNDFKYVTPGSLMPGTGVNGQGGSTERTVYGDILFPIRQAPAFAQSQVFMHWGNCGDGSNQIALPAQPGDQHKRYHCTQNSKPLMRWEGHPENYAYPWRDNFCEARGRTTDRCPAGKGHQGQDIRPSSCTPQPHDPDRCKPDIYEVVAADDGMAFRDGHIVRLKNDAWAVYYVYLHMNTATLDAAGMIDQQAVPVARGQVLGKVGDFEGVAGGTSEHLHFEVRTAAPIKPVSPYMTLIRAYERLLGAQGVEIAN